MDVRFQSSSSRRDEVRKCKKRGLTPARLLLFAHSTVGSCGMVAVGGKFDNGIHGRNHKYDYDMGGRSE